MRATVIPEPLSSEGCALQGSSALEAVPEPRERFLVDEVPIVPEIWAESDYYVCLRLPKS